MKSIRLSFFVVLLIMVFSMDANAWLNQFNSPDTICIYFDEAATQVSVYADAGTSVDAYVILREPSLSFVDFWNFTFFYQGPIEIVYLPYHDGSTVSPNNSGYGIFGSFPTPLPTLDLTVLARMVIQVLDQEAIYFNVPPDCNGTTYSYENETVECHCFWQYHMPSAVTIAAINDVAPVSADCKSWGSIKATFR
jgi:hypothetical protein